MASLKVEICLKKKNPPRAQIFRYFRIESRNKKIVFVPCNRSIIANKLRLTNLKRFIRRIKSPLTR